jgi:hypothetical protein
MGRRNPLPFTRIDGRKTYTLPNGSTTTDYILAYGYYSKTSLARKSAYERHNNDNAALFATAVDVAADMPKGIGTISVAWAMLARDAKEHGIVLHKARGTRR